MSNPSLPEESVRLFWSKIEKTEDGCWIWKGASGGRQGYGSFSYKGKAYRAHRLAWSLENGPIPEGHFICHRCDNPPCVNPAHLFAGTALDNVRDMWEKGRAHIQPKAEVHYECPKKRYYCQMNCTNCGKEFTARIRDDVRVGRFCTYACRNRYFWRSGIINLASKGTEAPPQ